MLTRTNKFKDYTYYDLVDWTDEMISSLGNLAIYGEDKGCSMNCYRKQLGKLQKQLEKKIQEVKQVDLNRDLLILLEKVYYLQERSEMLKHGFVRLERLEKRQKRNKTSPEKLGKLFETPKRYKEHLRSPQIVRAVKKIPAEQQVPAEQRGWFQWIAQKGKEGLDWWVDPEGAKKRKSPKSSKKNSPKSPKSSKKNSPVFINP